MAGFGPNVGVQISRASLTSITTSGTSAKSAYCTRRR